MMRTTKRRSGTTGYVVNPCAGGTYSWKVSDNIVYADTFVSELFGIPEQEADAGLPLSRYLNAIHPDDIDRVSGAIAHAVSFGAPYEAEYRVTSADGRVSSVLALGQCFRDADGQPTEYVGMIFDFGPSQSARDSDSLVALCVEAFRKAQQSENEFVAYLLSMALIELGHQARAEFTVDGERH